MALFIVHLEQTRAFQAILEIFLMRSRHRRPFRVERHIHSVVQIPLPIFTGRFSAFSTFPALAPPHMYLSFSRVELPLFSFSHPEDVFNL